jgi:hypothetical protein
MESIEEIREKLLKTIKEISDYTGLPFSIGKCSLNKFENAELTAIKEVSNER